MLLQSSQSFKLSLKKNLAEQNILNILPTVQCIYNIHAPLTFTLKRGILQTKRKQRNKCTVISCSGFCFFKAGPAPSPVFLMAPGSGSKWQKNSEFCGSDSCSSALNKEGHTRPSCGAPLSLLSYTLPRIFSKQR